MEFLACKKPRGDKLSLRKEIRAQSKKVSIYKIMDLSKVSPVSLLLLCILVRGAMCTVFVFCNSASSPIWWMELQAGLFRA